jgi:four helix bundle protein
MMLRRCAIGIATAIVEGCGRESAVAFAGDLQKSVARCNELEYLVLLAHDLRIFPTETTGSLTQEVIEVRKMTNGLLRKL